jgi:hypothetical protein
MAGGLMQLVAYGAQDVYLTGQPKVTFFQAVYKRHTNFAMENITQTINGSATNSGRISVTIARNGDLVGNMYMALTPANGLVLTSTTGTVNDTNWLAERAVADVELTIGGQRIDKHYQNWWRLYAELFLSHDDKISWNKMTTYANPLNPGTDNQVYLPLIFFFNRNPGLYLPLIALQYHEVRLDFNLSQYYTTYFSGSPSVWANYVYLDTEERRRFAQKGHEYLIEQLQYTGTDTVTTGTNTIRLSYNHPVKELIWCETHNNYPQYCNLWSFVNSSTSVNITSNAMLASGAINTVLPHEAGTPHLTVGGANLGWIEDGPLIAPGTAEIAPLASFKLMLNGQDRFAAQPGKYFNQIQPFLYHSGNPYPGIYCYSFALKPEEHQPTGTCNFSRIDNAQVVTTLKAGALNTQQRMYAVNYNVLRIQSGMGGLAFSN